MIFPDPLSSAFLLRRYKRFLADVRLPTGQELTVHCANPGGMTGLVQPEGRCWISRSDNPKRKLPHSLELVEVDGAAVLVNTARTNPIVREALEAGRIALVGQPQVVQSEVRCGESRLDFRVTDAEGRAVWIEVKQVTLANPPLARFPDARTTRGARHMNTLRERAEAGEGAAVLFCITRSDCDRFAPAEDVDPDYAAALRAAAAAGVSVLAYVCDVGPKEIAIARAVPVAL